VQPLYWFTRVEELMKRFILFLESPENHNRILKGAMIVSTLISIGMFAMFLPGIFNK
jgi:hypothetical protein